MHMSGIATTCTPAPDHLPHYSAVADEIAVWADPITHAYEDPDLISATAQASHPSNKADKAAPSTQCSLPSGLGTLTVATCETTTLQPWSSRKVQVNADKFNKAKNEEHKTNLQGDQQVRRGNAVARSGMLSGRCRMQRKPTLKPGMTVTEVKNPTRVDREEAIRLRLENEKLQQENAHLRELLDIVHSQAPMQTTTAGRLAPNRALDAVRVDVLRVTGGDGPRVATANGLGADDGTRIRAVGCGDLRADRNDKSRAAASGAALRHENLLRCRVAQLERQVCRAEAELQRRRGCAAEAERALKEVTQRLGAALPEEDSPDDAWLGAVDRLTGLRNWGRGMLCRLRDMRCTREQGPGAEACEKIEKEHSVAWSVPYFIPGGSDFMKENAQPATTVRGLCMGEGTLLANPVQVHALESQLALLAPDVAAAADTLRSLIMPNLPSLAPTLAADITDQMRRVLSSIVAASTKLSSLACLLPMPMPNLTDISNAPPHIQASLRGRADAGQQMPQAHGPVASDACSDAVGSNSGTCRQGQAANSDAVHLQSMLSNQVKHCSEILHSVAAAIAKAREQNKQPVAQACAAVEAVATAHHHLQARRASKLCMVRLLKELSLHAATLEKLPQLLTSCLNSSQEAVKQVLSEEYLTKKEVLSMAFQNRAGSQ